MRRSTDRILTTHTGSLPRPDGLTGLLVRLDQGQLTDAERVSFDDAVRAAVLDVVARQRAAGVRGQPGHRPGEATGLPGLHRGPELRPPGAGPHRPGQPARRTGGRPGRVGRNPDHATYLSAIAETMKVEYDAIHAAGHLVQLDCPDLAMGRHLQFPDLSLDEWLDTIRLHVEAIDTATRDIPADRLRMHLCWGNYEGPHTRDVDLRDIVEVVLGARPAGLSFEASNPRHDHEWRVWEDVKLPGQLLAVSYANLFPVIALITGAGAVLALMIKERRNA